MIQPRCYLWALCAVIQRFSVWAICAAAMVPGAGVANAQNYPNQSIRIVTSTLGMGVDVAARIIAPGLAENLGQQVIVVNTPGGGPASGEVVAKAPGDGYTLVLGGSTFVLLKSLQDKLPWDPVRDFSPITMVASAPNILLVHPSLPVKSVKELVSMARLKPGVLHYGAGGAASPNLLAGDLLKAMARINIITVSFRGLAPALNALIGGEVELGFASAVSAMPHVRTGKLRALAVTAAQPTILAPGLPTVAASGVPEYESVSIYGLLAPVTTPVTIINRLHQEIIRVLNTEDIKEKFFKFGADTSGISPQQYAARISSDIAVMGKIIRDNGIRGE